MPLLALALQCPDGAPPPCNRPTQIAARPAAPPAASSIAVLPFANRSPDAGDAYLAEGLTEEISNRLTRVGRLQVKARGLVNAQWQRTPDPFDAARRLNVAWFVHGNVRHVGQQLLVNVELVRATTGEEVWASRFPRGAADVFAVQAEVAESVAVVVGGRLSPEERAVITARPTTDNEAYRLYLRGNVLLNRRTEREVAQAVQLYTQATTLDPRFAAAWARLGMAREVQASWTTWTLELPRDSMLALAGVAIQRALAIDSLLPDALLATAMRGIGLGDVDEAHGAIRRAARDSLNAEVWYLNGLLYGAEGGGGALNLPEQAIPLFRRSLALDPTQRAVWRHLALSLRDAGRLAEAEAAIDSVLVLGPWDSGTRVRSYIRYLRGNLAGAAADAALDPDSLLNPVARVIVLLASGDSAGARFVGQWLLAQSDSGRLYSALARVSMILGRHDDAMTGLQRMWDARSAQQPRCGPRLPCSASLVLWRWLQDPGFAPLRSDPRFVRLVARTRPRVPWLADYR